MKGNSSVVKQYEQEMKLLTQENSELREQIQTLKNQFDKAVNVSSALEESYKKNSELSKELQKSESLNDDLKKRLEISMRNCAELESKIMVIPKPESLRPQLEACKAENSELQLQINSLNAAKYEIEAKLNQSEAEKKALRNELDQIYRNASSYFSSDIGSIESLLQHFIIKPQMNEQINQQSVNQNQFSEEDFELCKAKIKKLKGKIEKWKLKYQQEHELCITLQTNRQTVPQENQSEKEELKYQILELHHQNKALTKKLQKLTDESDKQRQINAQQQAKLRIFELQQTDKKEEDFIACQSKNASLTVEIQTLNIEKEKLKTRLSSNASKIKSLEKENSDLRLKYQTLEGKHENVTQQNEKLKKDNTELAKQIKTTERQKAKTSKQLSKVEVDLGKLKKEKMQLDEENEKQMVEVNKREIRIDALMKEKETLEEQLRIQNNRVEALTKQNEFLEEQTKQILQNSLANKSETPSTNQQKDYYQQMNQHQNHECIQQNQYQQQQKPVFYAQNQFDIIPLASWTIPDIPNDIAENINTIARNPAFPAPKKIKTILETITQYFNNKMRKDENEYKLKLDELVDLKKRVISFTEFLKRRFTDLHIDFGQLLYDDGTREIFNDYIVQLMTTFNQLTQEKAQTDNQMIELYVALDADTFTDAKSNAELMRTLLTKQKEKITVQKKELSSIKKVFAQRDAENQQTLEELEKEVELMKSSAENLEKTIEGQKEEIENLCKQRDELTKEKETLQQNVDATINDLTERCNGVLNENEALKSIKETYEKRLKQQKDDVDQLIRGIQELKSKHKLKLKETVEDLQSKNDQIMQQMRSLTEESTNVINELRKTIEEKDKEIDTLNDDKTELEIKLKQQETKINATITENERNKKAQETQMAVKIKAIEAESNQKVKEAEQNNQTIIDCIASIFSPILATGEKIDQSSYETTLNNIKSRFDLLIQRGNRIRNILNIGPSQSIEDAILALIK